MKAIVKRERNHKDQWYSYFKCGKVRTSRLSKSLWFVLGVFKPKNLIKAMFD